MIKTVGIKQIDVKNPDIKTWKRNILYFDQLAVWGGVEHSLAKLRDAGNYGAASEFEFLATRECIFPMVGEFSIPQIKLEGFITLLRAFPNIFTENKAEYVELREDLTTRFMCIVLAGKEGINPVPILSNSLRSYSEAFNKTRKVELIEIVLHSLPIPDDNVPWEQILDFKNDEDSTSKLLALRNWINEIAKGTFDLNELEEKLEYLLDQYDTHMKFHRMKCKKGVIETVVTTTAEVMEDLMSFRWGKMAHSVFSIKNKQLYLMEEEMKAPGREVAYIYKAKERFS